MPRVPKPFRWRSGWYTDAGGRRIKLLDKDASKKEADAELRRLLTEQDLNGGHAHSNFTVVELFALFLDTVQGDINPDTYIDYQRWLTKFAKTYGWRQRTAQLSRLLRSGVMDISPCIESWCVITNYTWERNTLAKHDGR